MNLGFPEMIFLFFLALIIFGPKKMPEIGRQLGKAINEFKRASNEFKAQIEAEISQLEVETHRQILPPTEPPHGTVTAEPAAPHGTIAAEPSPPENTMLPQLAGQSESESIPKGHDA
jgi:TatA/E family protein of Tat protein translocase